MENIDVSEIRRPILYRRNEDYVKQLEDFHLVEKCVHCNETILDANNKPLITNEFVTLLGNMKRNVAKTEYFQHEYQHIEKKILNILEFCHSKRKEQPFNPDWVELQNIILSNK